VGFPNHIKSACFCLCISTSVFAAQITGTATNGTTNKPAAGDEVVLLSLAAGMDETAHTKTDAQGRFTLNVSDEGVQHLVRVIHQGVNYYRTAPPGTASVEINVYDAAREVPNILQESRMLRIQTKDGQLEVAEAYTLRNESQPPRTRNGDHTFEVTAPDGAQVLDGMVAGPGGMPTTSVPVATGKKNQYSFNYAIKPGRSQFQVVYKLPYSGSYEFAINPETPLAQLGVLLPKSMKFSATAGKFAPDADEAGMAVFFAKSLPAGQPVKFSVLGEGSAPREAQGTAPGGPTGAPGGGLGAPIDAPDPLASSRGFIIGGFIVILAGGAFWLFRRSHAAKAQYAGANTAALVDTSSAGDQQAPTPQPSGPVPGSRGILDALKEELFQLESDRLHESISQQEYEKQKAGLDALLRRQMKIPGQSHGK
jgi:hypothetical protein